MRQNANIRIQQNQEVLSGVPLQAFNIYSTWNALTEMHKSHDRSLCAYLMRYTIPSKIVLHIYQKGKYGDLIAATGPVILIKLHSNRQFLGTYNLQI